MFRIFAAFAAAFFLGCICTGVVFAATIGIIRGTVTVDGKPVAGANLTLTGEGSRFTTKSDAQGVYIFSSIPYGNYVLVAHIAGMQDSTANVTLASNSVVTLDLALSQLKEIASAHVSAGSGVSGTPVAVNQLDKAQIQSSPEQDSLDRLIETLPGIVRFSYDEPVALGFHGVTYQIDGAPLPLATSSNFAEVVDPKDIDSLEVYTGDFPAEYGGDRMGALVNIITNRPTDLPEGNYGEITGGFGNQAQAVGQLFDEARSGSTEVFLSLNSQRTNYGLEAPTYVPINDNSSQSDQFLRVITQVTNRSTLAFDYGNQLSQFQIPINTDPNNSLDPEVSPPDTNDVQREYDRFGSLNYSLVSQDGNGVFQVIPWYRMTQIVYAGDLANDVLATEPDPITGNVDHLIGLYQDRFASYAGLNISDFRATKHHAWKIGIDSDRENFHANQTFACYFVDCVASGGTVATPYFPVYSQQAQAGTQIGAYAEDTWQPSSVIAVQYGLRYDHSTGYVGGWMVEPRIGVNIQADSKNVLHLFYGRFYAAPQLEDVRQACVLLGTGTGECPANPVYDLQPERDDLLEMGVQHTFNSHLSGYVDTIARRVINVLDTTQLLNTPLFAVFNNALGEYYGIDGRLTDRLPDGDLWYFTTTVSSSNAGGISGSTFLFGTQPNPPGIPLTSEELLSPEDHDQTVAATAAYTHHFGQDRSWLGTLEADYGTGYPVAFENATENLSGRLPTHLTFNGTIARNILSGPGKQGIGVRLDIDNILDHQYVVKIANGFNTTQIAPGRSVLLRLTAPF